MIQFWQNPSNNPAPAGEPYEEFEERVVAAWEELLNLHNNDQDHHYLLVAHGGVIRAILRNVLNFPTENFFRIDVPYASLCRIKQEVAMHPRLIFLGGTLQMTVVLQLLAGIMLDRLFGEVRRFHPLVGFGWLGNWIDKA